MDRDRARGDAAEGSTRRIRGASDRWPGAAFLSRAPAAALWPDRVCPPSLARRPVARDQALALYRDVTEATPTSRRRGRLAFDAGIRLVAARHRPPAHRGTRCRAAAERRDPDKPQFLTKGTANDVRHAAG